MYHLTDPSAHASPALLVYPQLVEQNIDTMIAMAGSAARLMPHVKTHKMGQIVQMQLQKGITRFKCATFAEAQMLAMAGAKDILMAYQLNNPVAAHYAALANQFPDIRFSSLADNIDSARLLSQVSDSANVYIDIDSGMHRTGIAPEKVMELHEALQSLPNVHFLGLHAYDGHIRTKELEARTKECDAAFAQVAALAAQLPDAEVIVGGTPTFPVHAKRKNVILSPGTCVLWDEGYRTGLPEQHFTTAALLLTRVISKPQSGYITLDLGHKAVSAESAIDKRVFFHELPEYEVISQSEEHLVVKTPLAESIRVGDVFYGTPWHVCPTVALYNEAQIIENGARTDTWPIIRGRRIG